MPKLPCMNHHEPLLIRGCAALSSQLMDEPAPPSHDLGIWRPVYEYTQDQQQLQQEPRLASPGLSSGHSEWEFVETSHLIDDRANLGCVESSPACREVHAHDN